MRQADSGGGGAACRPSGLAEVVKSSIITEEMMARTLSVAYTFAALKTILSLCREH